MYSATLVYADFRRSVDTPCITTHVGCLLCVAWGVCKYSLNKTKWRVNFRDLLKINGFPENSLLQYTLELSSSTHASQIKWSLTSTFLKHPLLPFCGLVKF